MATRPLPPAEEHGLADLLGAATARFIAVTMVPATMAGLLFWLMQ